MPSAEPLPQHSHDKTVDWEIAKNCLAQLDKEAPAILRQAVVIGGIACWFYRHLLGKAQDPDFKIPKLSAEQEHLWLSKDIDFTNFFAQDARDQLKSHLVRDAQNRLELIVAGVPIGFAQVGVTFDPESAWAQAWIATFTSREKTVEFRVLDPVSLYREKLALTERRGSESDSLHLALLAEFLRFETCRQAGCLVTAESLGAKTTPLRFLFSIRDRAIEICRDERVRRRVRETMSRDPMLPPSELDLLLRISQS